VAFNLALSTPFSIVQSLDTSRGNIFNRANFAPPIANETVFDQGGNPVPGAGAINEPTTSSRQIQFGLKLSW
jgi:hypothetical protein